VKIFRQIKKLLFHTKIGSILSYSWEIGAMDYKLKEILSNTETDFWRRAARISRLMKLRNEVIRETMRVTQIISREWETTCLYGVKT
jgi:hypothetical protein